jgi:FdhD protein
MTLTVETEVWKLRDGASAAAPDQLAAEAPLELRLGGRPLTVVMRTPGADEELVRGFLFTEGLIATAGDVVALRRPEGLTGDEVGNVLAIELAPTPAGTPHPPERLFYASSSCGVCGKSSIAALAVRAPLVRSSLRVAASVLEALPERLRAAQPAFAATGGLHAAGLFLADGTMLAVREDVGRHNALDKLIGWALVEGRLPLDGAVLVVSGRVGYEILQKAIAAGVPLIAAVGAPSSLAVELAEQFGVTVVGFVRPGSLNVYSHRDRLR